MFFRVASKSPMHPKIILDRKRKLLKNDNLTGEGATVSELQCNSRAGRMQAGSRRLDVISWTESPPLEDVSYYNRRTLLQPLPLGTTGGPHRENVSSSHFEEPLKLLSNVVLYNWAILNLNTKSANVVSLVEKTKVSLEKKVESSHVD